MKKIIGFLLFVLCLGSGYGMYYLYENADMTAPEISLVGEKTCQENQTEEEYLKNVKATDEVEGDVSSSLIVEQMKKTENGSFVVYAARDSKNNVTRMEVAYTLATPTPVPEPTKAPEKETKKDTKKESQKETKKEAEESKESETQKDSEPETEEKADE